MSEFNINCFLSYMELLKQYNRSKSKKEKEKLKHQMELLKNGFMPIKLVGDK